MNPPRTADGKVDFERDFFGQPDVPDRSAASSKSRAFACALGKVYTFGPTFRAENSNTSRGTSPSSG